MAAAALSAGGVADSAASSSPAAGYPAWAFAAAAAAQLAKGEQRSPAWVAGTVALLGQHWSLLSAVLPGSHRLRLAAVRSAVLAAAAAVLARPALRPIAAAVRTLLAAANRPRCC